MIQTDPKLEMGGRIKLIRNRILVSKTNRNAAPYAAMRPVGGTPRPQRCPLQRPLRVGPLLSPSRSSVSLFITLNNVLWVHE
jgi:hypothetical protein